MCTEGVSRKLLQQNKTKTSTNRKVVMLVSSSAVLPTLQEQVLNSKEWFEKSKAQYEADPRTTTFNGLILGEQGTGKTNSLLTLPRPLVIISFDIKGTDTIHHEIIKPDSNIIVLRYWEHNFSGGNNPIVKFNRDWQEMKRAKVFDNIASIAMDSSTTWMNLLLMHFANLGGRVGNGSIQIEIQDYLQQSKVCFDFARELLGLPCHVVMLGHILRRLAYETQAGQKGLLGSNSEVLKIYESFHAPEKLGAEFPSMFSNCFRAQAPEVGSTRGYSWSLVNQGGMVYKSRHNVDGKLLKDSEPQDFRALFKKVGLDWEDKQ